MQKGSGGVVPGGGRSKAHSGKRGSRRGKKGRGKKRGGRPGRPGRPGHPGQSNRPRGRPRAHCVCTACGTKVPLYTDVPCYVMSCPKCGLTMVKEGAKPPSSDDEAPTFVP
jgi:hypothetical protein